MVGELPPPPPPDVTVKSVALVALPAVEVVTRQLAVAPGGTPVGTVAVICVGESTVKLAAFDSVPLTSATAVTFTKFVPVIFTWVPTGPLVGVKLVIVGALDPPPPPGDEDQFHVCQSTSLELDPTLLNWFESQT